MRQIVVRAGNDGIMRFRNDLPQLFRDHANSLAPYSHHVGFEHLRIAGVNAISENIPYRVIGPKGSCLVSPPHIRQIDGRCLHMILIQGQRNLRNRLSRSRQRKDMANDLSRRLIYHNGIMPLPLFIAIGNRPKRIFAVVFLHVHNAFDLAGNIMAVHLVDKVADRKIESAGVFPQFLAVETVVNRNEAYSSGRKLDLKIIAGFQIVSCKT